MADLNKERTDDNQPKARWLALNSIVLPHRYVNEYRSFHRPATMAMMYPPPSHIIDIPPREPYHPGFNPDCLCTLGYRPWLFDLLPHERQCSVPDNQHSQEPCKYLSFDVIFDFTDRT